MQVGCFVGELCQFGAGVRFDIGSEPVDGYTHTRHFQRTDQLVADPPGGEVDEVFRTGDDLEKGSHRGPRFSAEECASLSSGLPNHLCESRRVGNKFAVVDDPAVVPEMFVHRRAPRIAVVYVSDEVDLTHRTRIPPSRPPGVIVWGLIFHIVDQTPTGGADPAWRVEVQDRCDVETSHPDIMTVPTDTTGK